MCGGSLPDTLVYKDGDSVRRTGARDHHLFGGRLLKSSLGLRERAFAGLLHVPDGDHREWAAAEAWATGVDHIALTESVDDFDQTSQTHGVGTNSIFVLFDALVRLGSGGTPVNTSVLRLTSQAGDRAVEKLFLSDEAAAAS